MVGCSLQHLILPFAGRKEWANGLRLLDGSRVALADGLRLSCRIDFRRATTGCIPQINSTGRSACRCAHFLPVAVNPQFMGAACPAIRLRSETMKIVR